MKIELSETDIVQVAEIVTENLRKGIIQSAVHTAHFEAMVEKGKEMAIRLYGDMASNDGVYQVLERKVESLCRTEIRNFIKEEVENLIGDDKKLQKLLFEYLLDGVVDKAKRLAYKVNYGWDEDCE